MKIITLNTWGGAAGLEPLLEFFKSHQDVDVFCLQEIFNGNKSFEQTEKEKSKRRVYDLLDKIQEVLPEHLHFFNPQLRDDYGIAIFAKKDLNIVAHGEFFIHKFKEFIPEGNLGLHARSLNYVTLNSGERLINIINIHGLWNGQGKTDTDDRIAQSEKIVAFISQLKGEMVLVGDLNLRLETESVKIIEASGLRNLIKEFNVPSTRTSLYKNKELEKFADYAFVSPEVNVKKFEVLPDEVSDHAPLLLEI
jgi:exonuclease III